MEWKIPRDVTCFKSSCWDQEINWRKRNRKAELQHGSAKLRRDTASTCRAFPRMFRASKTTSSNSNGQATNADTFWSLLEAVCLVARTMTISFISFLDSAGIGCIGLQDSIDMSAMWRFDEICRRTQHAVWSVFPQQYISCLSSLTFPK